MIILHLKINISGLHEFCEEREGMNMGTEDYKIILHKQYFYRFMYKDTLLPKRQYIVSTNYMT